ncbi:molybdopterin molybdotransferase MoeA [Desulfococcus multivorans]|uniref:Molybdopterin molybdenumtransferase n=1 Tax=Desulfococcus multivorans DSM 2059 TaxID=1121405 RepID=S7TXN2_DESML|nr:gephyrin-like molybdotransferase Glp [Desulfococcus multivorans]AOY56816.1 MoeA1: molybdopterin biosynthesis protein [Desulfococcus multivorans]AQU99362.1 molybdopterin molybdenumtransferase MoeA [Desulfococcus multivorans]EPR41831.1 MoeA domain protein domain I and II [Desulfococcus multivorans DSM 2059]SJZ92722.1 molybdopterin molybdotransferase [Desulfococcus multivorans DSM 2059]
MIDDLAIGLEEAFEMTLDRIAPLTSESVDLIEGVDRVVSEDLAALVDSPSVDASLKDGYAVLSDEVAAASAEHPVRLSVTGMMAAGEKQDIRVVPGTTVRVLTGAKIPTGADAVVSEEFVKIEGREVLVGTFAEIGRNILARGSDVGRGKVVARKGSRLTPGMVGMLAAAGHSSVSVIRTPMVGILATGDEVVAPGQPLPEGKLYASNITTLGAWCRRYRMKTRLALVRDDPEEIYNVLKTLSNHADAVVTSGGAWTGDRDMVVRILDRLGWQRAFHRIRIGPGKAVGFGLLEGKPVFILPGGPPSNLMGFLQIALPGLLKLAGHGRPGLPVIPVRTASDLLGRHPRWTQFIFGMIETRSDLPVFYPLKGASRLQSMAEAEAVIAIPEGETVIPAGTVIPAQLLE